jgi:outer membrane scaffolding protein for murein synthesis (MipA/OmpV family)
MDNRIIMILPTRWTLRLPALTLALMTSGAAHAVEDDLPAPPPQPAVETRWEGALGLNASYGAFYQGGDRRQSKFSPGFFLRHGRFTLTNSSGYVTRRADDVFRGLGVDLSTDQRLRLNLALRFDAGRSQGTDPALNGLGDIRRTVRARLSATWRADEAWRLGAAWSVDVLGRGGGGFGDLNFAHEHKSSPDTTWTWGASLSMADGRWMRNYFGVDAAQAAASGYPMHDVGSGLRDVAAFASVRHELSARWLLLGGVSASRLLGSAAESPLTRRSAGWGTSGALAWRF